MDRVTEIHYDDTIGRSLMLLTQTSRLIDKYMDAYFYKKAHLSFSQFLVIKTLAAKNGEMTPTQLAEWTQTELHNITTFVARLKKQGLVSTERSATDQRSLNVLLTEQGWLVLKQAMPVAKEIIDQIMSSISEPDASKLSKILEVLRDNAYDGLESINRDA